MESGVALHCPMSSKNPRLHFVVNAFVDDVVALVETHFGVALFDRHPAFGGGACTRRLRCASSECCGDEDEPQNGYKIAGVWGRLRAHVAESHWLDFCRLHCGWLQVAVGRATSLTGCRKRRQCCLERYQ